MGRYRSWEILTFPGSGGRHHAGDSLSKRKISHSSRAGKHRILIQEKEHGRHLRPATPTPVTIAEVFLWEAADKTRTNRQCG
jgi:hypothetical protein